MNPFIIELISSASLISGMGLLFGLGLGVAGKVFAVKEDEKVLLIKEALPGVNCGGCGYPGCEQLAVAIAKEEAPPNGCPVGGASCAAQISEIMGIDAVESTPYTAYVKCAGGSSRALFRYDYRGLMDCKTASLLAGGGSKSCKYGCIGMGSCIKACKFGAISFISGIAYINPEKCTACGMCIKACPRSIIELVPTESKIRVACNSKDSGKIVMSHCKTGCLGCRLCEKVCAYKAVHVEDMIAKIDYEKCVMCGDCIRRCPTKAIEALFEEEDSQP